MIVRDEGLWDAMPSKGVFDVLYDAISRLAVQLNVLAEFAEVVDDQQVQCRYAHPSRPLSFSRDRPISIR